MPRNGDGSSDNGPFEEAKQNIIHGSGPVDVCLPSRSLLVMLQCISVLTRRLQTPKVDRADKTAPLPEGLNEQGAGIPGMNASGGQSQGIKKGPNVGQGKGPLHVDQGN
ncbi:hypothetical protein B0I35DRAFT_433493 [Stachybotrys elegans]|uniref:Uncharacterized protein n=1 Tax=Stachybotrys elegans TaxID=80388 RepID=A0A8K0SK43_9HYPO|nr:hypothetical protein B0I35DRAFT_433493 [Stachybotrys elegans]